MSYVAVQLEEILISIFEYLPSKDIQQIKLSSSKFNELAHHYVRFFYFSFFLNFFF